LKYGNISAASIGAIQRGLLHLEDQGGNLFFGEPEFNVFDFIQTDNGKGVINILAADKLLNSPKLYATFLLWMLSSLYEELPEVGDLERPKFIFFFDEAHLLFDEAPEVLLDKIEQIVRLIRSKGVGVYFITQNPLDIPETILGQLGNRIQHALRAFTPRDQKAVKTAAQTFRQNPAFDTEKAIMELGTGEALVSFLDEKGAPSVVELAKMLCPQGQIGPITTEERNTAIRQSPLYGIYEKTMDRESAYELLQRESETRRQEEERLEKEKQQQQIEKERAAEEARNYRTQSRSSNRQSPTEKMFGNMLSSVGRTLGTQLVRSVLGTLTKRR
jgi:DNA helicase HerA-like ATPase